MAAVVLVGVMVDRATLTMRTIAVAAFAVMLLVPEAVVHPSFQMSFAATLALIAAYERGIPWAAAGADTSLGARLALWGVREVILLITASLVAGLATMPYAAYHFHRMAPYGLIANLFAMPVISAVSMPAGLLARLAMPFGFDAPLWRLMGVGIDWMVMVALWVAHLPGAVGRISAFGVSAMLLATAGLLLLCLLRSPLRFAGGAFAGLAIAAALMAERPDILISGAGDVVAVRGADSRLAAMKFGSDTISVREWLAADGDDRASTEASVKAGFACDADGCVARLPDGAAVAVSRTPAALADDCARARSGGDDASHATWMRRPGHRSQHSAVRRCDRTHLAQQQLRARLCAAGRRGSTMGASARVASRPYEPYAGVRARRCDAPPTRHRCGAVISGWLNTSGIARRACPGCARGSAAGCGPRRRYLRARAQSRRRAGGSASVSLPPRRSARRRCRRYRQGPASLDQRDIAVENAGVDHRIAAHLKREMLARRQQIGRHVDDAALALDRLDGRAGSDAAHDRNRDRTAVVVIGARGPYTPQIALDDVRNKAARACRADTPWPTDSGSLITSMARARLGRRRMKPRSSSAVISRWMPDLERRSSASFISSKEGGTPASFSRSWMKRSNSYCLRVNIRNASPGARCIRSRAAMTAASNQPRNRSPKQIMNGHYPFHMCSATF